MTSRPGKQTVTINILTDISKSKDNHTMKFGELRLERSDFLKKFEKKNVFDYLIPFEKMFTENIHLFRNPYWKCLILRKMS